MLGRAAPFRYHAPWELRLRDLTLRGGSKTTMQRYSGCSDHRCWGVWQFVTAGMPRSLRTAHGADYHQNGAWRLPWGRASRTGGGAGKILPAMWRRRFCARAAMRVECRMWQWVLHCRDAPAKPGNIGGGGFMRVHLAARNQTVRDRHYSEDSGPGSGIVMRDVYLTTQRSEGAIRRPKFAARLGDSASGCVQGATVRTGPSAWRLRNMDPANSRGRQMTRARNPKTIGRSEGFAVEADRPDRVPGTRAKMTAAGPAGTRLGNKILIRKRQDGTALGRRRPAGCKSDICGVEQLKNTCGARAKRRSMKAGARRKKIVRSGMRAQLGGSVMTPARMIIRG